ncbi:Tat protein translocase TatB subunit [Povalibacter uvarum]|uniref:Tat protein translocase TatB subunit n=1 Tax=Povalibacter uvarum TaxID=732238 RepID=A0A841HLB7_9GAMM|nr:Sec-independent protein translocase protein TatB [Povalibacter uvarum]MBB6093080.1 Tat protein translocase TatB subunit [Povalibacter uvarum]
MFEVGFTEIVLILGLALLVLGPEKLPGLAQKVGRWTGRARAMARQLRTQLEQEVTLDELSRSRPMNPGAAPDSTPAASENTPPTSYGQSAGNPPPYNDPIEPTPGPTAESAAEPAPPAHSGPGLDLDKHVSGIEPAPPADEAPTTKNVQ